VRDREGIERGTQDEIRRQHSIIGGNPVGGGGVVGLVREKEIEVTGRQERGSMQGGAWGVLGR